MLQDVAGNRPPARGRQAGRRARIRSLADAEHLIVAFSGGADSVLAAHIAAGSGKALTLWYLHHYDTAVEPERLKVFQETRKQYPRARFIEDQADISQLAKRMGYSWEHTASLLRRKRLLRLRSMTPKSAVVTGHNYSDYLETLALRRARKIPEEALPALGEQDLDTGFLRPLYHISRSEVRGRIDALGLNYFDDPANDDLKFARNRLRSAPSQHPLSLAEEPWCAPLPRLGEGRIRELQLPLATWNALTKVEKSRTLFSAFRRLAVVRKFTRGYFSRAHKLPFDLPPFFAHVEKTGIIFRRGLGDSCALTQATTAAYLRGNAVTRKISIAQSYGSKSVGKIFSEKKLSPRQRRQTLVYLDANSEYQSKRIVFQDGTEILAAQ